MKSTEAAAVASEPKAEGDEVNHRISRILDIVNASAVKAAPRRTNKARGGKSGKSRQAKEAQDKASGSDRELEGATEAGKKKEEGKGKEWRLAGERGKGKEVAGEKGLGKGQDLDAGGEKGKGKDAGGEKGKGKDAAAEKGGDKGRLFSREILDAGKPPWRKKAAMEEEKRISLSKDAPIFKPAAEFRADAPSFEPAAVKDAPFVEAEVLSTPPAILPMQDIFGVPPPPDAVHVYSHAAGWVQPFWPEEIFPEVIPGQREGEFLGLQSIAEMGEWVVLREKKPKALPFFWNMMTGEKSWEAPDVLQELGVAETLLKWSEDLPETGIEPSREDRNPDPWRNRRRNWRKSEGYRSSTQADVPPEELVPPPPPPYASLFAVNEENSIAVKEASPPHASLFAGGEEEENSVLVKAAAPPGFARSEI
mmetsp:Transcript_71351/g.126064  ORF Transcript_71351/g.126064 Transcript_71351/m.126064 type:complete len:422 (-) Transcript_71351:71-1336(-)|eukprot:CAMPEP_0197634684 /NCGR_PEP_ID=MMETSP1338-20131121/10707_1 /TAXON_ID=43686 ORGANISM="Pelagodinium beii, Strain RCC1491" /NCGR_SAMPLE_ID=MMETSP1338 /ASSEMBLY_ACC=CAM_ASM_000754 /LENGTH=421 /DNA_ID=CAMNT_0043206587 /DNA_START=76 /DNA_END=1341 /DNA_ORIENTATION=+